MKKITLLASTSLLLTLVACGTPLRSINIPFLNNRESHEIEQANCDFAFLFLENDYNEPVSLIIEPNNEQLGNPVNQYNGDVFCIEERHLNHDGSLNFRLRTASESRERGVSGRIVEQMTRGDIWKISIPNGLPPITWNAMRIRDID